MSKKIVRSALPYMVIALIVGLIVGSLVTRCYYKRQYKDSVICGSVDYYDKNGEQKLFSDKTCQ